MPDVGPLGPVILAPGVFGLIMALAPMRHFFELVLLRRLDYVVLGSIAVAWGLVLRLIWRPRLFKGRLDPH